MAVPHGLMVKRCSLEIIERTQSGDIGKLKLVEIQSLQWDIINAGIHWLWGWHPDYHLINARHPREY
jgi:hypothetical protein